MIIMMILINHVSIELVYMLKKMDVKSLIWFQKEEFLNGDMIII